MHTHKNRRLSQRHPATGNMQALLDSGFRYSRRLAEHRSCVNALAFSSGDGRWLASGGDDLRILLWDFHQEEIGAPSCSMTGHRANIFTIDFSAKNQYIYSGGTDEKVLKYDLSRASSGSSSINRPEAPASVFTNHNESVRGLSCNPYNDEIFLSASEDMSVLLHDGRAQSGSSRASGILRHDSEFTDVHYHPQSENLFITADQRGDVCLRDVRMSFDDPDNRENTRSVVLKYVTSVTRRSVSDTCKPEASSIAIDRDGKKFAVTFLHYQPNIYGISDPFPLATCNARFPPGSDRNSQQSSTDETPSPTYRNSCTIKHGSFGGPGLEADVYYSAGSDDFRSYVWKIPDLVNLKERRRVVNANDFAEDVDPRTVAFTMGGLEDRFIPLELDTPLCRLGGHQSIVNTTLFHPHLPQIATCGIESHITLHSPTPMAPNGSNFTLTDENVRQLPGSSSQSRRQFVEALLEGPRFGRDGTDEEDEQDHSREEERTIAFFDSILRQYQDVNLFTHRRNEDFAGLTPDDEVHIAINIEDFLDTF